MRGAHPPSAVVGAVAAEGVVIMEVGVWRVGGELALLQTGNLYVPAALEEGKLSPAVLGAIAVKLQEGATGGWRGVGQGQPPPPLCSPML